MRSVSLDMNMASQPPAGQYPMRTSSPYTLMQQQQQGMVGNQGMMANQATLVNAGERAVMSHWGSSHFGSRL